MFTHCRVAYGSILCASGRWTEAEAQLLDALGPQDHPVRSHRPQAIGHLAELRVDQGRVAEAADLLEPFRDHASCCRPLARVHLAEGNVDLAEATLQRGLDEMVGDVLRQAPLLATLAEVHLRAGHVDAADAAAEQLAALAAEGDLPALQSLADHTTALVCSARGDDAAATAALNALLRRHAGQSTLTVAQASLERAELSTAAGDVTGAIADARTALAIATHLGAAPLRDRASSLLRDLGDTGRARPRNIGELRSVLSPREQEVLALIAEGLTNAQIGERLFISKKTAEHHVGRVLTKLGVRSRAEAAAMAVRLGVASTNR